MSLPSKAETGMASASSSSGLNRALHVKKVADSGSCVIECELVVTLCFQEIAPAKKNQHLAVWSQPLLGPVVFPMQTC